MKRNRLISRKMSNEGIPDHKDLHAILGQNPFPDNRLTVAHYEISKSQAQMEAFFEAYGQKVIVYDHLRQRKHDGFWTPSRFPRVEVNFVRFSEAGIILDLNHSPGIVIPTPGSDDIEHCVGLYFLPTNGHYERVSHQSARARRAKACNEASQAKAFCLEWGIINERERYQQKGQLLFLGGWYHK